MRSILLPLVSGVILAAAIEPNEVRVAYAPYTPRGPATFRAEARTVETPVVVRDGKGKTIDLLQQRDFRILDNGKEREITSFVVHRADGAGTESAPARLIALVFDDVAIKVQCGTINVRPNPLALASIAQMRDAAAKFVRKNLRPEDRVTLIGFGSGQIVPFTNDPAALLAAIRKVEFRQTCSPVYKLPILEDVVDYMVRLHGERDIVLCSRGISGTRSVMEETVNKAIRGGVPIHTLNMVGVGSLTGDTLAYLADNTGGRNFHNNNDFDLGLQELLSPPTVSYGLSFTPDEVHDGRYHSLKVQLPDRKGYTIEARPGYFAPDAKLDQPLVERSIDRAVMAEDTRNGLPVTTNALADKLVTGEPAVLVVTHVDVNSLAFRVLEGRHVQKLRIVVALLNESGGFVAGKEGEVEFALKDASLAELSENGVNATLEIPAPAGEYRVRMVVEEQGGKLMASTARLRIP